MRLEPKTIISNRYEVIRLIGSGGMANVYRAKDIKLDRDVSLKVLKEDFVDKEFKGDFDREARAAAKINHINIANVYDVGNDGDIYYIIMEYVDGYTLKDLIRRKAPFINEEVLGVAMQIANALEVAHKAGIVHRDIKPENILVTKEGSVKVTDFGIARATTSNTITTDMIGSVHYFSPEQAKGGYVDFKSDIYSLGIIMYEMITGKIPFKGDGVVELAMKHINDPLPNMKDINPNISSSLEKIILKASAKNQDKRYQTAEELNIDLKKALSDKTGTFIKDNNFYENSETIIMNKEDIDTIKNTIKKNNEEYEDEYDEEYDEEYEDEYEDEYDEQISKTKKMGRKSQMKQPIDKTKREKIIERKVTFFAILTALFIIMFITGAMLMWVLNDQNSVVPNFTNMSWKDAVIIAEDKEIYIANVAEEVSQTVPEGNIISQNIQKGIEVKKGETIEVIISLGDDRFELDDFVGKDISDVYKQTEDKSIILKEEYIYSEDMGIGKVVRQSPEAEESIRPNTEVNLYISRGEEEVLISVPNVVGISGDNAKSKIVGAGLKVGKVTTAYSNTVGDGNVISQSLNASTEVIEGTPISIVVSIGEKVTTTETTTEQTTIPVTESEDTTEIAEPIMKKDILIINPPIEDGIIVVDIKVVKVVDGVSSTIWSNSTYETSAFPLELTVLGDKPTQYEIYVDGKIVGTDTKTFE